ncbi:6,7-dimethyl-8-ribityllumazine synthase [Legionella sp. CNM-4043-24]|uniref:6,7-dimethyl-8-ribityllumazine synthase n=1 Tax=Legionella sp. CNM-4043-24 TaxID=3421646 RepID=UPI00403ACB55
MSREKILVVSSNYYKDLSAIQLDSCRKILDRSPYLFDLEIVDAGAYEIPAVIQYFHKNKPYNGYIPLALLLKGSTDHYEFIWEHVKSCFIQFAMDGILIGNGIISAPSMEILRSRVENNERVEEAYRAVDYLIRMQKRLRGA